MVARVLEEAGLVTVQITMTREHTERVKPPRALFVTYPFGHPLGDAEDPEGQRRVVRAALALLDRPSGPVLQDFGDPRYATGDLTLPQAASIESKAPAVDPADELTSLRPWYERWVEAHGGRTSVGLTGVPQRRFRRIVRFLQDYAAGNDANIAERPPDVPLPRFIRLCANDLKAFYFEAQMTRSPERDFQALARWFWGETALADLLRRVRDRMKASGDPALDATAFGIAR